MEMKLNTLKINNFRCFKELEVELDNDYTVLIGTNGAGKTSILEAMTIALGSFVSEFDNASGNSIHSEDARYEYYSIGSRVEMQPQFPVFIEANATLSHEVISWTRSVNKKGGSTTVKLSKDLREYARNLNEQLMNGDQEVILPIISYYGTGRLWMQKRKKKANSNKTPFSRQSGYTDCLSAAANEKLMLKWLEDMTYIELQDRRIIPELEAVKEALKVCYHEVYPHLLDVEFRYNVKSHDLEVYTKKEDGTEEILPVRLLSDGIKGILGMVADISYRMAILNPQMLDNINQTPGIVLIDEIDMHLHPAWQKKIISNLKSIFPKVQFIFTTHSPSVLSNVQAKNVLILDNYQLYRTPTNTYGRDVDAILREIMHTQSRPQDVLDKLNEFSELIDEENIDAARKVFLELEHLLGSDNEDVVSARITLALEEIEEAEDDDRD